MYSLNLSDEKELLQRRFLFLKNLALAPLAIKQIVNTFQGLLVRAAEETELCVNEGCWQMLLSAS